MLQIQNMTKYTKAAPRNKNKDCKPVPGNPDFWDTIDSWYKLNPSRQEFLFSWVILQGYFRENCISTLDS